MILAIESSCDESALALFDPESGIKGEWVHSQVAKHQPYGGVVPDIASRSHLECFGPMLSNVIAAGDISKISRVAVTIGPGLAGCLAMGLSLGKAMALAMRVPLCGVNHLRGHAFSPFIALHGKAPAYFDKTYRHLLPHLGLLVSGGNTLLFRLDEKGGIRILARTVDDAAGEALDKGAKLLGMPYPGGPLIEKTAVGGDAGRYDFPISCPDPDDRRFSFSGLKTSLRYRLEKIGDREWHSVLPDLCASYQEAVIRQLLMKTGQMLEQGRYRSLGLSGGVANNRLLRAGMEQLAKKAGIHCLVAEPRHTGDNAAMIAFAAWLNPEGTIEAGENLNLSFNPSWPLAPDL